jgi:hypothetical protein
MKKLLVIILAVELLLAIILGQAGTLHRRDFDRRGSSGDKILH